MSNRVLYILCLIFALPYGSYAQVPTDSIVAYWPFNGNALDESGNNHNGAVYGPVLDKDRFSNDSSAFSFDGIDDYIEIGDTLLSADDSLQEYTLSAWIKTTGNSGVILSQYSYSSTLPSNRFLFMVRNGYIDYFKGGNSLFSQNTVNDGNWHHVAAVKSNTGLVTVYIDGVSDATGTDTISFWGTNTVIGSGINSGSPFSGVIDDIRIYKRALSMSEVNLLFNEVVGIEKSFVASGLRIYPNPTTNKIIVKGIPSELQQLKIYTITGQEVTLLSSQSSLQNDKIEIDLSGLSSGVYFIKTKSATSRVVKQDSF